MRNPINIFGKPGVPLLLKLGVQTDKDNLWISTFAKRAHSDMQIRIQTDMYMDFEKIVNTDTDMFLNLDTDMDISIWMNIFFGISILAY